jgi:retron-type reverse transcriptase
MKTPTRIARLRSASSLHSLAHLLGYEPKGLAYVVYGIDDKYKYTDFQIPKRRGGVRTISAPIEKLKLLQKRVATLLEECIDEIDAERGVRNTLSHGFRKKHSILTNAAPHRNRRYVFNVDLHNFFGTVDFGRISGYLKKNKHFQLNPTVARMLAQIACHQKVLPQGSPCSPAIANLVAHILDIRLARLAARNDCHYSRYADDLTFSTNRPVFPSEIARRVGDTNEWVAGKTLLKIIRESRFEINPEKTRMQFARFRQDVTGVIVNRTLNVRREYVKNARAMVDSYVTRGAFYFEKQFRDEKGAWTAELAAGTVGQLRGMLSHIDSVRLFEQQKHASAKKARRDYRVPRVEIKDMDSASRTFRRFLLYTQLFNPEKPLIICEGKTDKVYIQCALRQLADAYPQLATKTKNGVDIHVSFFNFTKVADRILRLGGGTGDFQDLIAKYGTEFKGFYAKGERQPVILLIDNDDGTKKIFSTIKNVTGSKATIDGSASFYHIADNFYVVAVPQLGKKDTTIEHFFDPAVLTEKLGTKVFSGKDQFDPATQYGKHHFAEYVVKKKQKTINFAGFGPILTRLDAVLTEHAAKA